MAEASPQLFVHSRRPEWGLAREVGEQAGKVRFVFQDGHERAFHRKYLHMMVPADKPDDVVAKVADDLDQRSGGGGVTVAERHDRDGIPTFEAQVRVFKHLYPEGFQDPSYVDAVRGSNSARRRKKHRDPSVADAGRLLSNEAFEALAEDPSAVHAAACEILTGTDLAGDKRQRRSVAELPPEHHADFAQTLQALLHGDGPLLDRFARWVALLDESPGGSPSWSAVTTLAALVHPHDHVAIKPTIFERQARRIDPRLVPDKRPNAALYNRYRDLATTVRDKLAEAGLHPRDLLDVRSFMEETMRPKAQQILAEIDGGDEAP